MTNKRIPVLGSGWVLLVDYWGEEKIARAAGISRLEFLDAVIDWSAPISQNESRRVRFLERKSHTVPIELGQIILEFVLPLSIMQQLARQRTFSIVQNSRRYVRSEPSFYLPEIPGNEKLVAFYEKAGALYNELLKTFKPELARNVLPNSMWTRCVVRADAHNLFNNFLPKRLAPSAQWEMQEYARAISVIAKDCWPNIWAAAAKKYGWE